MSSALDARGQQPFLEPSSSGGRSVIDITDWQTWSDTRLRTCPSDDLSDAARKGDAAMAAGPMRDIERAGPRPCRVTALATVCHSICASSALAAAPPDHMLLTGRQDMDSPPFVKRHC